VEHADFAKGNTMSTIEDGAMQDKDGAHVDNLVKRLSNRTEMINYGNGDVRDIPDEDCVEAASELTRLREKAMEWERLAFDEAEKNNELIAEIERLKKQCEASVGLRQRLALAEEIAASLSAENERLRKALIGR
jgi:uncharacterized protein YdcH (DUF465 family)